MFYTGVKLCKWGMQQARAFRAVKMDMQVHAVLPHLMWLALKQLIEYISRCVSAYVPFWLVALWCTWQLQLSSFGP